MALATAFVEILADTRRLRPQLQAQMRAAGTAATRSFDTATRAGMTAAATTAATTFGSRLGRDTATRAATAGRTAATGFGSSMRTGLTHAGTAIATGLSGAWNTATMTARTAGAQIASALGTAASTVRQRWSAVGTAMATEINKGPSAAAKAGSAISRNLSLPAAVATAGIIAMSSNFEAGMNRVKAVTNATGPEFTQLNNLAKQLGATTKFSASEAADAMGFLGMAGLKTNQIMAAMPSTLQLAAAAQMDLGQAADITSNIMTGYGFKAEQLGRVNDVLAKTMSNANVDISMLGESFKYVGPIAKQAGLEFSDTAALIGLFGNAGIQGSMAGTSLRNVLLGLQSAPAKVTTQLDKLGVSLTDSSGKMRPMIDVIYDMAKAGITGAQATKMFGTRGGPQLAALLDQGLPAINRMRDATRDSEGSAKRMADTMNQGAKGGMTALKSAAEGLAISIGESGLLSAFTKVVGGLTTFVRWMTRLPDPVKAAASGFLVFTAVLGPVILIAAKIASAIAVLKAAFIALGITVKGVLISTGIGALLVAIGVAIYFVWTRTTWLQTAWSKIVSVAKSVGSAFASIGRAIWSGLKAAFDWIVENWPLVVSVILGPLGILISIVTGNWDKLKAQTAKAFQAIAGLARKLPGWIWDGLKAIGGYAAQFGSLIGEWTAAGWARLRGFVTALPGIIAGWATTAWSAIKEAAPRIASAVWEWVLTATRRLGEAAVDIGRAVADWAPQAARWLRDKAMDIAVAVAMWEIEAARTIRGKAAGIASAVAAWIPGAVTELAKFTVRAPGLVTSWVGSITAAAAGKAMEIGAAVQDWVEQAAVRLAEFVSKVPGVIARWAQSAADAISQAAPKIAEKITEWMQSATDKLVEWTDKLPDIVKGWTDALTRKMSEWANEIPNIVNGWADSLQAKLVEFIEKIPEWIGSLFKSDTESPEAKNAGSSAGKAVGDGVKEAVSTFSWGEILMKIVMAFASLPIQLMQAGGQAAWALITSMMQVMGQLPGMIGQVLMSLGPLLWQLMQSAWQLAVSAVSAGVSMVVDFVSKLPSRMSQILSSLGSMIGSLLRSAWQIGYTVVSSKVTEIVNFVKRLPTMITGALSGLGSALSGLMTRAWDAAKRTVTSAITWIVDKVKQLPGQLASIAGQAARSLIDGVKNLIPSALRSFIPGLARGAIVTGPTYALIGEAGPEVVIPLSASKRSRRQELMEQSGLTKEAGQMNPRTGTRIDVGGIHIHTPARDPEAVAMAAVARLARAI
ncbi:phage tail tape measure protein [Streptomyces sp. NBC_01304]|uniref:phage tail tape measure protein n=1 Tax=Streptomyces sp. NBC_01304 TaxID=2903818 RepID=UPI002E0D9E28|nr:phage tail tape measure protein [Streptomyces sp. NBC_01304]